MQLGYAHRARRPPAFPLAADAMAVASMSVILWNTGLYNGCRVRKYAVADPIIPVDCQHVTYRGERITPTSTYNDNVSLLPFCRHNELLYCTDICFCNYKGIGNIVMCIVLCHNPTRSYDDR